MIRAVGMFRSGIDLQTLEHRAAHAIVRQHALDRQFHGVRGIVDEDFVDLTQETTHNLEMVAGTPSSASICRSLTMSKRMMRLLVSAV